MLTCKEVTEICSAEMDRPLKWGEQISMRSHLVMCSGCNNYHKQMQTLRQAMQAYADGRAPAIGDAAQGDAAAAVKGDGG